jgi:phosphoribosylformimino-5-aminoimidazole carboxamide ribotide isomerase
MRLIPVIDLLNDQVVHAVKGERQYYKPVESILCHTSDPLAIASAFRDRFGLNEIYIADLNAIQGAPLTRHRVIISEVASQKGMKILLDAGASDIESAQALLGLGVSKVVIGAETLQTRDDLFKITDEVNPEDLVFSLDMRAGKILSRCSALAAMPAMKILEELQSAGWKEVILLDLDRVGSSEGARTSLVLEVRTNFPELELLLGGGIARPEELIELKRMGIGGVMLATALHSGAITISSLRALELL